jgi:hypothetical protein
MTSPEIGFIICATIFSAALMGMALNRTLPDHHLDDVAKDVIKLSMAILGTLTAVVIGFLIANANASFSARRSALVQESANVVRLDDLLRRYGPETSTARQMLQTYVSTQAQDMFPTVGIGRLNLNDQVTTQILDHVEDQILSLKPADDRQKWLSAQALQLAATMNQSSWQFSDENLGTIPLPFLFLLVIWLSVLFASFGLFAPRNGTVIIAFLLCAISVSAGLKIVLDLDTPFGGPVRMSGFPLRMSSDAIRSALDILGAPSIPNHP